MTVKESCSCGAALEVSAPTYYASYLTERLEAFEQEHRQCRATQTTSGKPVVADVPDPPAGQTVKPTNHYNIEPFKATETRSCLECGNTFTPEHRIQKLCGDKCRKVRQQHHAAQHAAKVKAERQAQIDADDQAARQLQAEQRAKDPPVIQTHRREPNSVLQSAPRIKPRKRTVVHLPPAGGYAAPGSPEAAAAIERVKQGIKSETGDGPKPISIT